jgi:Zn finger protein HypA/HybF involved in hydrogenase expression
MHEMSLCEGILNILQKQSKIDQYSTVKTVVLEVADCQVSSLMRSDLPFRL